MNGIIIMSINNSTLNECILLLYIYYVIKAGRKARRSRENKMSDPPFLCVVRGGGEK
jgi:hypothetical protein